KREIAACEATMATNGVDQLGENCRIRFKRKNLSLLKPRERELGRLPNICTHVEEGSNGEIRHLCQAFDVEHVLDPIGQYVPVVYAITRAPQDVTNDSLRGRLNHLGEGWDHAHAAILGTRWRTDDFQCVHAPFSRKHVLPVPPPDVQVRLQSIQNTTYPLEAAGSFAKVNAGSL